MKLFIFFSLFLTLTAWAELGGAPARTLTLAKNSKAQISSVSLNYVERQDQDIKVREYFNAQNVVYAVSWSGPVPPDLSPILGSYYPEYLLAVQATSARRPRRALAATSANIEIHTFGHMGDLHGIVILHDQMPKNLKWVELE